MENVEKHRVTAVFRRPSIAALAAGMLIAPIVGCTPETPTDPATETVTVEPTATDDGTEPTADTATEAPEPTSEATADETAAPDPSTSEEPPADGGAERPTGPVEETLQPGETAQTQYFDVTMLGRESNDDATAAAIEVNVCYVAEHPDANDDGTTRVSADPWRFGVYDGETQLPEDVQFLPVSEFEASSEFTPAYEEKQLQVGECNTGWIAVGHGNPDLAWASVRYQPADFGDVITWDLSGS